MGLQHRLGRRGTSLDYPTPTEYTARTHLQRERSWRDGGEQLRAQTERGVGWAVGCWLGSIVGLHHRAEHGASGRRAAAGSVGDRRGGPPPRPQQRRRRPGAVRRRVLRALPRRPEDPLRAEPRRLPLHPAAQQQRRPGPRRRRQQLDSRPLPPLRPGLGPLPDVRQPRPAPTAALAEPAGLLPGWRRTATSSGTTR